MEWICKSASTKLHSLLITSLAGILLLLSGCGPKVSSPEQIQKFNRVGAIRQLQNEQEQIKSKYDQVYHIEPGDMLKLTMPATLREMSWDLGRISMNDEPYFCRVDKNGKIALPIVGLIPVVGKTPSEIEAVISSAHYPRFVIEPPAVVCNIAEYHNERYFAIMGLVRKPDSFEYPFNAHYTLTDALAMAGGVDLISDPHYATVYRQDSNGEIVAATFKINGKNLAKASKVLIEPGDIISVENTLRTGLNRGMDNLFHFGVGASANVTP